MLRAAMRRVLVAMGIVSIVTTLGGVALWRFGDGEYSVFESIYFALITVSTVGYSEMPNMDLHVGARVVTVFLIVAGIGTIAFFQSTLTTLLIEGVVGRAFRRRRMNRKIRALENHIVVAGCGRTGSYVVAELAAVRRPFVVADRDESALAKLDAELDSGLLYVVGDATEDSVLLEAGIERAAGVVAALPQDPDNLFIALSARSLNPSARIVSKVVDFDNESKLKRAGADVTVSPHRIGGLRLVSELLRPKVTSFLDNMLRVTRDLRFEEIEIPQRSSVAGKLLREVSIREHTNLLVIAVHQAEQEYLYNPGPDHRLRSGSALIVAGEQQDVEKLRQIIQGA